LNDIELRPRKERRGLVEFVPYVFGGTMLIAAFAFAGHYMGQNASAHNITRDDQLAGVVSPSTAILSKGSLLPADTSFEIVTLKKMDMLQQVAVSSKGDFVEQRPAAPAPSKVLVIPASVSSDPDLKNAVASVTAPVLNSEPAPKKLAMTPSVPKLEKTFKLKSKDSKDEKDAKQSPSSKEKQKVIAQRRVRLAEENCLARAIYFEARSESELGQLAVAKVILNRTRDPNYPKTICGVVYQGSDRRNSCQFSFACDGMPDDVKSTEAWNRSKKIAQRALAGDRSVKVMSAATHYHADYVKPKWSRSMKRLIKIGRHIFYSDT
jgi:spore germination cell wall hydrolase CwlJ-like protein